MRLNRREFIGFAVAGAAGAAGAGLPAPARSCASREITNRRKNT